MKPRRRPRVQFKDESGFGLVEVMVSAVVMVLVATATVASIGASQKQSARTLSRSVAANLAEQDQERMRSYRATDLVSYTATNTVSRENVSYTVDSHTAFVAGPDDQEVTCTSTGEQSQFLQLTTTVTPNTQQAGYSDPPQTIRSLYALPIAQFSPTTGTLVVQVVNFDGSAGQPGVPVSISGPSTRPSVSTNSQGCAIFQFLASGSYVVTVNKPGFVNKDLKQTVTLTANVSQGNIFPTTPFEYDSAGSIAAQIKDSANGTRSFHTRGITVSNGSLDAPTTRSFTTANAPGLFPFAEPYHVFSGTCQANNPSAYTPDYFTTEIGSQVITPGLGATVPVREPTITTTIKRKSSSGATPTPLNNAPVTLVQFDPGCEDSNGKLPQYGPSSPFPTLKSTAAGQLNLDYYPFGHYLICTQYTSGSSTWRSGYARVDNLDGAGVSVPEADTQVNSYGPASGTCANGLPAAIAAAQAGL